MDCPRVGQIVDVMEANHYVVFKGSGAAYNLNLVGIRTRDRASERFNDWLTVFYWFDDQWVFFGFPATTDPGLFYRENPLSVRGTAILIPGQYRGAYHIGKHRGYKALQQKEPMYFWRDIDRDADLDMDGMPLEKDVLGANIHRANAYRSSLLVGKWSAGCQVVQDPTHFAFLMALCEQARANFGNSFTYTLLEESQFEGVM